MKQRPFSKGEWALLLFPLLAFGVVYVWNSRSSLHDELILKRSGARPEWRRVTWSPDSRLVALEGGVAVYPSPSPGVPTRPLVSRGQVQLFNLKGESLWYFEGYDSNFGNLTFSPDSKRLMGRVFEQYCVWDVASSIPKRRLDLRGFGVGWSREGGALILQSHPKSGKISYQSLDLETGVRTPYNAPSEPYLELRSRNGYQAKQRERIALGGNSGDTGGEIDIFDAKGRRIRSLGGRTRATMGWNRDTLTALRPVFGGYSELGLVLQRVDAATGKHTTQLLAPPPIEDSAPASGYSFFENTMPIDGILSPDARLAAIWSRRTVWMIDTTTAVVLWKKPMPKPGYLNMYRCAFSPDGRFLAWVNERGVLISNVTTGEDSIG